MSVEVAAAAAWLQCAEHTERTAKRSGRCACTCAWLCASPRLEQRLVHAQVERLVALECDELPRRAVGRLCPPPLLGRRRPYVPAARARRGEFGGGHRAPCAPAGSGHTGSAAPRGAPHLDLDGPKGLQHLEDGRRPVQRAALGDILQRRQLGVALLPERERLEGGLALDLGDYGGILPREAFGLLGTLAHPRAAQHRARPHPNRHAGSQRAEVVQVRAMFVDDRTVVFAERPQRRQAPRLREPQAHVRQRLVPERVPARGRSGRHGGLLEAGSRQGALGVEMVARESPRQVCDV